LEEVGNLLGVTRERVRQVQLAALAKLRDISRREGHSELPLG
jgi:DNA-directed RNA polymerase sigma subunit (sigma70/sigma32)